MKNTKICKIFLIIIFLSICFFAFAHKNDEQNALHENQNKQLIEKQKNFAKQNRNKYSVYGLGGGTISLQGRMALGEKGKYADLDANGVPTLYPSNGYVADLRANIWARLIFKEDSYLHAGGNVIFRYQDARFAPIFNIDQLYFKWKLPIGSIYAGRNIFSLRNTMIFAGLLDGINFELNAPFFNFKTFVGYSGLLGLFNPYFNPYTLTQYDRTYKNTNNIALVDPIYQVDINAEQSKRLFFASEFDIYLAGIHISPYFLMQIDLSEFRQDNYKNTINSLSTFHLGICNDGRIYGSLYYKLCLTGMFGYSKDIKTGEYYNLLSCCFNSQLRYTFESAGHSTLILSYSFGTGNQDEADDFWNDNYKHESNKFYYFGKFDGGYVLSPILSNIHSISLKYQVVPYDKNRVKLSMYLGMYQTLKVCSTGDISFDGFKDDNYLVGAEFDYGLCVTVLPVYTFGFDFGVFIPENSATVYPTFKTGINFTFKI